VTTIDERHLHFEFGPEWKHVEQWDQTPAFKQGIHGVDGVRALDIIALSDDECLLLEVKDFRDQNDAQASDERREHGHRKGRNKDRNKGRNKRRNKHEDAEPSDSEALSADALVEQVAQKVAGTLAGLVGAARMQDTRYAGDFASFLAAHKSEGRKVRIVLWIEGEPTSKGKSIRAKANLLALTTSLKRKVKWLNHGPVQVLSSASPPTLPGVTVSDTRT
jgi:hypothetical protein